MGGSGALRLQSWIRRPECLVLTTTAGQIKIEPRTPAIVHVVYTLASEFSSKPSLAVLPRGVDTVAWDVEELPGSLELRTDCVHVLID